MRSWGERICGRGVTSNEAATASNLLESEDIDFFRMEQDSELSALSPWVKVLRNFKFHTATWRRFLKMLHAINLWLQMLSIHVDMMHFHEISRHE